MSVPNICCGINCDRQQADADKLRYGILNFFKGGDDAPPFDSNINNAVNMIHQAYATEAQVFHVSTDHMRNISKLEFEKKSVIEVVEMYDQLISKLIPLSHSTKEQIRVLDALKTEQTDVIGALDHLIGERTAYRSALLKSQSFSSFFLTKRYICHRRNPCLVSMSLNRSVPKTITKPARRSECHRNQENMVAEKYFHIGNERFSFLLVDTVVRCPVCCNMRTIGETFFENPVSSMPALGVVFFNWKEYRVLIDSKTNICFDCCSQAIKSLEEHINLAENETSIMSYSIKLPVLEGFPEWALKVWNFTVTKLLSEGGIVEIDEILEIHTEMGIPKHLVERPHRLIDILQSLCDNFIDVGIVASPNPIRYHPNTPNLTHGFIQYSGLNQNVNAPRLSRLKTISNSTLREYVGNFIAEEASNYNRTCIRHLIESRMDHLAVSHEDVVNNMLPNLMPFTNGVIQSAFEYGKKNDNKNALISGQFVAITTIVNCFVNLVCQRPKAYTQIATGIGLKHSSSQEIRLKLSHLSGLSASPSVVKKELEFLKKCNPRKITYTEQANYISILDQCILSSESDVMAPIQEFSFQIDNLDYKIGSELNGTKKSANYCLVIGMVQKIKDLSVLEKEQLISQRGRYTHDDPIKAAIDKLKIEEGSPEALDSIEFSLEARAQTVRPFIENQIFDVLKCQNLTIDNGNSQQSTRIIQRTELYESRTARLPGDTSKTILEVIPKKPSQIAQLYEILVHILGKSASVWENGNSITIGSDGQIYDELWRICCTKRQEHPELRSVLPLLGSWHWLRKENLNVLHCLYKEFLNAGSAIFQSNGFPITDSQDPSEKVHAQDRIAQFTFQYIVTLLYKPFFEYLVTHIYTHLTPDNFEVIVKYDDWEGFMDYLDAPQLQKFLEHVAQYLHGSNAIRAGITDDIINSTSMFNLLYFVTNKNRYSLYALMHEAILSVLPKAHKIVATNTLSVGHDSLRPVHNVGNDESLEMSVKDVKDLLKQNPQISSFNDAVGILGIINDQKNSVKHICGESRIHTTSRESKEEFFKKNDVYRNNHDAWRDVAMIKILNMLMDPINISQRRLSNNLNAFETYIEYTLFRANQKIQNVFLVSRNIDMKEQPPSVDKEYQNMEEKGAGIRNFCVQHLRSECNQYAIYGNPNQLFNVMAAGQPTNASNSLLTFSKYNEQLRKSKADLGPLSKQKNASNKCNTFVNRLTNLGLQRSQAQGITDAERDSNIITSAAQCPTAEPFLNTKTKELAILENPWRVWQMFLNKLKLPIHGRLAILTSAIGSGSRSFDKGTDGPALKDNPDVTVLAVTADTIIFPFSSKLVNVMNSCGSKHNSISNISFQMWKYIASLFQVNKSLCHIIISFSEMDKVFAQRNRVTPDISKHTCPGLPLNESPTYRGSKNWNSNKERKEMARYSIFVEQIAELCIELFPDLVSQLPDDLKYSLDNKKITFDGVAETLFELTPGPPHRNFTSQRNNGDTVELVLRTIQSGPTPEVIIQDLQKFPTGGAVSMESSLKIASLVMAHVENCIRHNLPNGIMVISHSPYTFDCLIHQLGNLHVLHPSLILPKVIFQAENKPSLYINNQFFVSIGQLSNCIFPSNMPLQLRINQWLITSSIFSNPFSPPFRVLVDSRERIFDVITLAYSHTKSLAISTDYEDRLWMSTRTNICNRDAVELILLSVIRQANSTVFVKDWATFLQDATGLSVCLKSNDSLTYELCEALARNLGVASCQMPGEIGLGLYSGRVQLHVTEKIEAGKPRNFLQPRTLTISSSLNSIVLILKDGITEEQAIALTPEMFLIINARRGMTYMARFCNCTNSCPAACLCQAYCNPTGSSRCNALCSKKILQKKQEVEDMIRKRSRDNGSAHNGVDAFMSVQVNANGNNDFANILDNHDQVNFYLNGTGILGEVYHSFRQPLQSTVMAVTSNEIVLDVTSNRIQGNEDEESKTQSHKTTESDINDSAEIENWGDMQINENLLFSASTGTSSNEDDIMSKLI